MAKPRRKSARTGVARLTDIPNIGVSVAGDLRRLGITEPRGLVGKSPLALYRKLARLDGAAHDPCLLDTFMAAVDYMEGGPPRKWWAYTASPKKLLAGAPKGKKAAGSAKGK